MKDYYDDIADYIDDKLTAEDKTAFEKAMQGDADLRQAVEDYDILGMIGDGVFEEEVENSIKAELDNTQSESKTNGPKSINIIKWMAGVAALFIIGYLGYKSTIPKQELQYADLYVQAPWDTQRGGTKSSIEGAIELYLNNEKQLSIDSLKRINTPEAYYWLTEIFAADVTADSVLAYAPKLHSDNIIRDRVNYLKILAHFSKGDKAAFQAIINNLPKDTDGWYLEKYEMVK